jgi:hypothetical protein
LAVILTLLVIVLVVFGGGYFVYWTYVVSAPKPAPDPAPISVTPAPVEPTPTPVEPPPAEAVTPSEEKPTTTLPDTGGAPVTPAPDATVSDPLPVGPVPASPPLAPADLPPPEPSAAFLAWVSDLSVTGVFQGSPARALINGRTVREGEEIDAALGIVFDGVNPDDKVLIFREPSGATVGRRY